MFVTHVLRSLVSPLRPVEVLDLCAAPGGKSTAALSVLPPGSRLTANEPIRQRARVLSENIQKWGWPNCIVTNCYPREIGKSRQRFDVVIADVPCSGEGMFRKDPKAIEEWSSKHVDQCWRLQRDIVSDIWGCLKPGGLMVYSTCTFNTLENEENVRWICKELDAELLAVETKPEWQVTGSLLPDFHGPVYRFIPGVSRGEGLFMAVMRKGSESMDSNPSTMTPEKGGKEPGTLQGIESCLPLSFSQALAYLRGEALTLPPETPRGIVGVSFMGHTLGTVKNIGSRANNLYPKEWRIKTTHIPDYYTPILIPNSQKYEAIPESA